MLNCQPLFTCLQQQPHYTLLQTSILQLYPPALSQKISTCLLLWEQFMIGEAQLQRAFLSSGLQLSKACQHKSGGSLSCAE